MGALQKNRMPKQVAGFDRTWQKMRGARPKHALRSRRSRDQKFRESKRLFNCGFELTLESGRAIEAMRGPMMMDALRKALGEV